MGTEPSRLHHIDHHLHGSEQASIGAIGEVGSLMENLDALARRISVGQRIASESNQNFGAVINEKILRCLDARRIGKR